MYSNTEAVFGLDMPKLYLSTLLNIKKLKFYVRRRVIYDGVMEGEESVADGDELAPN